MANSELINKNYNVPSNVLKHIEKTLISNPHGNGVKRAKFILKGHVLTYQSLKRLKNYFDTYNPQNGDKSQYELAGGTLMKNFIEMELNADRSAVERSKEIKSDMTVDLNLGTKASKSPDLNEEEQEKKRENAIGVIVDKKNKILLGKRRIVDGGWGNGQYALIGGEVEDGETPEKACLREIKEETNLNVKNIEHKMTLNNDSNGVDYIFLCEYYGEPINVKLNDEHSSYGWFDINEMDYLDIVSNLKEYVQIATTLN